jgi:hypothetical protein
MALAAGAGGLERFRYGRHRLRAYAGGDHPADLNEEGQRWWTTSSWSDSMARPAANKPSTSPPRKRPAVVCRVVHGFAWPTCMSAALRSGPARRCRVAPAEGPWPRVARAVEELAKNGASTTDVTAGHHRIPRRHADQSRRATAVVVVIRASVASPSYWSVASQLVTLPCPVIARGRRSR